MRGLWRRVAFGLAFFSLGVVAAAADTITLKNGAKLEGRIIQRRPGFIEVDRGGPSVFYRTDDIRQIEWSDPKNELKDHLSLPAGDTELFLREGRQVKAASEKSADAPSAKKK